MNMLQTIATLMLLAALGGYVHTLYCYMLNTRHPNCDMMGAVIIFDRMWLLSSFAAGAAIALCPVTRWTVGLIFFITALLLGIPVKMIWTTGSNGIR